MYPEIVQVLFKLILRSKAGIPQIDALVSAQNPVYSMSFPSEMPQESYHERSNF